VAVGEALGPTVELEARRRGRVVEVGVRLERWDDLPVEARVESSGPTPKPGGANTSRIVSRVGDDRPAR
jgi:hypothetical protein